MGNVCGHLDHSRSVPRRQGSLGIRPGRGSLSPGPPSSPLTSASSQRNARFVLAWPTGGGPERLQEEGPTPSSLSTLSTSEPGDPASPAGASPLGSPSSPMYDFPQLTEKEKEHWKVFNELDNKDEADMLALSSFFQTVSATAARKGEALFPPVEEAQSRVRGRVRNIRVQNVGRIDSNLHDLREYELPVKGKVTLDVALDIIDCYRRGGKLHVSSVHKILKAVYWLLKKMPNIREVAVPGIPQLPPPHSPTAARANAPSCATTTTETGEGAMAWEESQAAAEAGVRQDSSQVEDMVSKLVVCGDLHGQFFDMLYVLDLNGPPSAETKYLFNGDFVDRGPQSVEVILTLFALQLAAPEHVYLNRGNHEDPGVCCLFGFMSEVMQKYDETTFSMFVEVFRHLPLATLINSQVAVVHGGLFHATGVRLEDLQQAPRADYGYVGIGGAGGHDDEAPSSPTVGKHRRRPGTGAGPVRGAKATAPLAAATRPTRVAAASAGDEGADGENADEEEVRVYLHQLMKDLLWSDPKGSPGVVPNPRGEGVLFGPDVTEAFLRENNLRMVVRSHECVPLGFEQPYEGLAQKQQLCTLFSASNYSSAGNQGAFLRFYCVDTTDEGQPPQGYHTVRKLPPRGTASHAPTAYEAPENLHYTVHCFFMGDELGQEKSLERSLQANLVAVVLKRRESLLRHFEAADTGGEAGPRTGLVTVEAWADAMRLATKVQVQWAGLRELLVQEDCVVVLGPVAMASENGTVEPPPSSTFIKYEAFLDSFQVQYKRAAKNRRVATKTFDALYVNRRQLEAFFSFFDKNGDGTISREEFRVGCETINAHLPPGSEDGRIEEVDRLLDLLDFDQSNSVSANEFFECFRLLDSQGHLTSTSPAELQRRGYQQAERRRASSKLLPSWSTSFNENSSSLAGGNRGSDRASSLRVVTSPNGA